VASLPVLNDKEPPLLTTVDPVLLTYALLVGISKYN
jgi:hypothetical protein